MNKQRRADLDRARTLIEEAQGIVDAASADEREYYDNMPESLQKGELAAAAADALESAQTSLEEVLGHLEEAAQ